MWSAHTTDPKRKEILTHATACMDLESVTLSEANISQRTKPTQLHFPEVPGVIKFIVGWWWPGAAGKGNGFGV